MGNLILSTNNPGHSNADHLTELNKDSKSSTIQHSQKIYH
jgi:hypothetical protein